MRKSIRVNMPTDVLWGFRKFKTDEVPTPKTFFTTSYAIDEAPDFINENGEFELIVLSVIGKHALLTNGSHRIAAAKRLGLKMIPVQLVVFFGEPAYPPYDEHTIKRFKPISRHLELWLKRFFVQNYNQPSPVIVSHESWYRLKLNQHFNLN